MIVAAIYDSGSDTLQNTLLTYENEYECKRSFKIACNKRLAQVLGVILDAPEDFYCVKIGELDKAAGGKLTALEKPERLFRFSDLMEVMHDE